MVSKKRKAKLRRKRRTKPQYGKRRRRYQAALRRVERVYERMDRRGTPSRVLDAVASMVFSLGRKLPRGRQNKLAMMINSPDREQRHRHISSVGRIPGKDGMRLQRLTSELLQTIRRAS